MKKKLLAIVLCAGAFHAAAQTDTYKSVHFGLRTDYVVLNDKTIGDVPMKGASAGLDIGFDNRSEKHIWGIGLKAGIGFLNTFGFPSIENRIADRYYGILSGTYMHSVSRQENRFRMFAGGKLDIQAYINTVIPFSNSQANYFGHIGLAPQFYCEYPFEILKKKVSVFGKINYDIMAVVMRPTYSMPFRNDRLDNIRLASFGSYGQAETEVGLFRRMKNRNAMSLSYGWQYGYYDYQNTVKQAVHNISFIFYFDL